MSFEAIAAITCVVSFVAVCVIWRMQSAMARRGAAASRPGNWFEVLLAPALLVLVVIVGATLSGALRTPGSDPGRADAAAQASLAASAPSAASRDSASNPSNADASPADGLALNPPAPFAMQSAPGPASQPDMPPLRGAAQTDVNATGEREADVVKPLQAHRAEQDRTHWETLADYQQQINQLRAENQFLQQVDQQRQESLDELGVQLRKKEAELAEAQAKLQQQAIVAKPVDPQTDAPNAAADSSEAALGLNGPANRPTDGVASAPESSAVAPGSPLIDAPRAVLRDSVTLQESRSLPTSPSPGVWQIVDATAVPTVVESAPRGLDQSGWRSVPRTPDRVHSVGHAAWTVVESPEMHSRIHADAGQAVWYVEDGATWGW